VPCYILLLNFPVKRAIPLASVTVMGGAVANNVLNAPKRHPLHDSRSCIDWDLILMMEPMTMAGALIGANLNDFLPEVVIVVLLLVLLTLTAYKTLTKAHTLYQQESKAIAIVSMRTGVDDEEALLLTKNKTGMVYSSNCYASATNGTDPTNYGAAVSNEHLEVLAHRQASFDEQATKNRYKSLHDAAKLSTLFAVVTVVNLIKGGPGSGGGPLGSARCDATCFWFAETVLMMTILAFVFCVRANLLHRLQSGGPVTSDIAWDERNTVTYSSLAIIAGLVAGLFGIGGGIVKGPLMLQLGVHPAVASATSAAMILFTSSTATVSYSVFGLLIYDYALLCFLVGFCSTLLGQLAMSELMKKYNRNSYIAYSIGIVVGLSAVCMSVESIFAIMANHR